MTVDGDDDTIRLDRAGREGAAPRPDDAAPLSGDLLDTDTRPRRARAEPDDATVRSARAPAPPAPAPASAPGTPIPGATGDRVAFSPDPAAPRESYAVRPAAPVIVGRHPLPARTPQPPADGEETVRTARGRARRRVVWLVVWTAVALGAVGVVLGMLVASLPH